MFPCVYTIMTDKSEASYRRVIYEIKNGCLKLGKIFNPNIVLTDYEQAAINAFKFHFPSIEVQGCFFHYGQCLFKKLIELGFKKQYGEYPKFKNWFKQLVVLALIPPKDIETAFEYALDFTDEFDKDEIDSTKLEAFTDYVFDTWVCVNAIFSSSMWNHYDNLTDPRTNNHVEGFHLKLSKMFPDKKPNIWAFIEKIKKLESSYSLEFERGQTGKNKNKNWRSNKDLRRDIDISTQLREYAEQRIDLETLISKLSDLVHEF